jgi:Zn-finger nucleic acid-binding protein
MSIYRQGPTPAGSCPRCLETLIGIDGVPSVRRCEKCGGVFADNDASRRIVSAFDRVLLEIGFQASTGKPRAKELGRALTCPECLIAMQKIRIESAVCEIDACPAHGSWFDPGELEDVMRAYRRAREAGARPPPGVQAHGQDVVVHGGREEAFGSPMVTFALDALERSVTSLAPGRRLRESS